MTTSRACDATSGEHADAQALVEFLMGRNGTVDSTQDEIAYALGMLKLERRGVFAVDKSRFNRACNHLKERVDREGLPCCGYRVHYRRAGGGGSTLSLVDPSGDLGEHAKAAVGTIQGWASREKQHQTENRRMINVAESLGDHALANGDKHGYRLLQRVVIKLDEEGTVPPALMAELDVWLAGIS